MVETNSKRNCESCGSTIPPYNTVHSGSGEKYRVLCMQCHNAEMSESRGIHYVHHEFDPLTLKDQNNVPHTFHFRVRSLGVEVAIDAFELIDGNPGGYSLMVIGSAEDDIMDIYQKLYQRIQRMLSKKHIEKGEYGMQFTDERVIRGRIEYDEDVDEDNKVPCVIIDGKELKWDEFGRMLMTYEGFHFKMQIIDPSEES